MEDEGAVPMRTTPFPNIVHETPAAGVYPGLTPAEGEESVGGDVVTLSPHIKEAHVAPEPGFDLTDALTAPSGESSIIDHFATLVSFLFHFLFPPFHQVSSSTTDPSLAATL